MAKESLHFPEDQIPTMVAIVRAGLEELKVEKDVDSALTAWCDQMIAYWDATMTEPAKFPARKRPAPEPEARRTTRKRK